MTNSPVTTDLPRRGVLVGVDHGRKRIGLAVTDVNQTMALPLTTLVSKSPQHDAPLLRQVRDDYCAVGWVVGLPLHMSGDESAQSQLVRKFGIWLAEITERPVIYWDERLTSSAAEAILWSLGESPSRNKARIDGLAAQAILQAYLRDRPAVPL
ncbi:Holliday junction resolvase RuvX [bacterium]|nr:Holliday junction resolvase RuvX [bacterium]